jgi:general L-amino acid transport system permease protein
MWIGDMVHVAETLPPAASEPPKPERRGAVAWARQNLFNSLSNTVITLLLAYLFVRLAGSWWTWLVGRATWHPADIRKCIDAGGACFAFLQDKWRLILFGTFPYDEQWRAAAALVLFAALVLGTALPIAWATQEHRSWLGAAWLAGVGAIGVLLAGGFGLARVEARFWSGLPLTVMLAFVGMIAAFGLAVLLALGRRSTMPVIRWISIGYIELVRGVPLISLLFMANIMLPIVLPRDLVLPNLLRAQLASVLFFAAYMAVILRCGLQAITLAQFAAAKALGLTYWQQMRAIILPQAFRTVIPSLVNIFIAGFKDTSLVVYVGMSDLLGTAQAAKADPRWYGLFMEAYFFIAAIYLGVCATMSWYSRWLERRLAGARART